MHATSQHTNNVVSCFHVLIPLLVYFYAAPHPQGLPLLVIDRDSSAFLGARIRFQILFTIFNYFEVASKIRVTLHGPLCHP